MDRQVPRNAGRLGGLVDAIGHTRDLHDVTDLWHGHVGEAAAGKADRMSTSCVHASWFGSWMRATPTRFEAVVVAVDERGGQFGMCAFLTDGGAVFAVKT